MKPEKFVKKHARLILGFLVGVMALSLAISFAPGTFGDLPEETVAFETNAGEKVFQDELYRARSWAYAFHELSQGHLAEDEVAFRARSRGLASWDAQMMVTMLNRSPDNPFLMLRVLEQARGLQPDELRAMVSSAVNPPEEHFTRIAESLALNLRAAAALGIRIPDGEVDEWIHQRGRPWRGRDADEEFDPKLFAARLEAYRMTEPEFRTFVAALLSNERYLALMTDHARPGAADAAPEGGERSLRLSYALFDPDESRARIIITPSEIQKYYTGNPARFQSRRRVAFDYILAEYEAFLPPTELPTDAEIQSFYDANKQRYVLPLPPVPEGQPKPAATYQKIEDVRDSIRATLVRQRGEAKAQSAFRGLLNLVSQELGAAQDPAALAEAGGKMNLTALAAELRIAGDPLTWGVTPYLAESDEDGKIVEAKIGRVTDPNYDWRDFVFAEKQPAVGTICPFPVQTERGLALVRLRQTAEPGTVPLDEAQGRRIRRLLEAKERSEAAEKSARDFGRRIHADGLSAALSWARAQGFEAEAGETLYFPGEGAPSVDPTLARPLARAAAGLAEKAADPAADRWDVLPVKTGKGPRLLCVYLEDAVNLPPGDYLTELRERRNQQRWLSQAEARLRLQDEVRKTVVRKNTGS